MSEVVAEAWRKYLLQLQLHPLRTKAITSGILAGCSDVIAQKISGIRKLQLRRLLLIMLYGFGYAGPFGHFLHKLMEIIFKGKKDNKTVAKKVILEQLTSSPWNNMIFMTYYGLVIERRTWNLVKNKVKKDYPLIPGNDPHLVEKIIDPKYLNGAANTFREVQMTIERHGSWSSPWVGESGCAYNSGGNHVSNTFLDSFWYLDQLGMAAKYNTKVYCRQSLVGGNYGLLDTESFIPNPDYYSALLWHQVMGKRVLSIDISGSPYLRAYAHCRKHETGISLLLINLSKTSKFFVTIRNDMNVYHGLHEDDSFLHDIKSAVSWIGRTLDGTKKEEYHLTAKDGNHRGRTMLLNGIPLELTESGEIPAMDPVFTAFDSPVSVSPLSPSVDGPTCE